MDVPGRQHLFEMGEPDLCVDIDMAAHLRRAMGDTEVDHCCRTRCDRLCGCKRLLFELHTLGHAEAGGAGAVRPPGVADKTLVEMDVAINEARQHQTLAKIARLIDRGLVWRHRSDCDDLAAADGDVDGTPVGQSGVAEQRVDGGQCRSPGLCWVVRSGREAASDSWSISCTVVLALVCARGRFCGEAAVLRSRSMGNLLGVSGRRLTFSNL